MVWCSSFHSEGVYGIIDDIYLLKIFVCVRKHEKQDRALFKLCLGHCEVVTTCGSWKFLTESVREPHLPKCRMAFTRNCPGK